jgi:oligopeptide/dipeptide ABC transporter ATP-binding protein
MKQREEDQVPGSSPESDRLLDVRGLTVGYATRGGMVTAVDDVSFTIGHGERVALVGESGSGKTATCLAIAGFMGQSSATVLADQIVFDGVDVMARTSSRIPTRVPRLAMVFQDASSSLDPVWTIGSQLCNVIRSTQGVSREGARELAGDWLRKVGLLDTDRVLSSRPFELSGGMRQRAMIAIALSGTPQLLIADEPTSALDASLSRDAMSLLVDLTTEFGAGLLLVSHDIHLCEEFADRMLVMYGGRIVEEGRSRDLAHAAEHPYTQALLRSVPTLNSADLDELPTIAMSATGQHDPAGGCNFRPRCDRVHEACAQVPQLISLGDSRGAACWLVDAEGSGAASPCSDSLATAVRSVGGA